MKKIVLAFLTIALLASCGGSKKTDENATANNETKSLSSATEGRRIIEDVIQYFATFKPTEVTTMVLDKTQFEEKFNPARTMDIAPTTIDFDTYKVGAIVLPETELDTQIELDKVSIVDRKLIVNYSIIHEGEERTFTIVPVKIFQYPTTLSIDSVSFVNNNIVHTYAK